MKKHGDVKLPTRQEDIIRRFEQYRNHVRKEIDPEIVAEYNQMVDSSDTEMESEDDEEWECKTDGKMDGDETYDRATFV